MRDVPFHLEAAVRRIQDAGYTIDTHRIRADHVSNGDWDTRIDVDEALMSRLAGTDTASDSLRAFASRVDAGTAEWHDIERILRTLPPEVIELKASKHYRWCWGYQPPVATPVEDEPEPYRIPWQR
jgi:hypothetical protein